MRLCVYRAYRSLAEGQGEGKETRSGQEGWKEGGKES
jgi:hypothetical protein